MGNVTASPPVTLIPLAEERPLENPGTFEEIHRKTKGIFGALQSDTQIVTLHELLSPQMSSHSLLMEPRSL